jgi:hypothetical protein
MTHSERSITDVLGTVPRGHGVRAWRSQPAQRFRMDKEFQMFGPVDARATLVQAAPRQSRITRRLRTYGSQSFSRRCDARMKNTAATR